MHETFSWRPYLAGALAGLLAIASVVASTYLIDSPKYLGASTTFVRATGLIEQTVDAQHVASNEYFQEKKVQIDWQLMMVAGIFLVHWAPQSSIVSSSGKVFHRSGLTDSVTEFGFVPSELFWVVSLRCSVPGWPEAVPAVMDSVV